MLLLARISLYSCQKCTSRGDARALSPTIHRLLWLGSICGKLIPKVLSGEVAAQNSQQKPRADWRGNRPGPVKSSQRLVLCEALRVLARWALETFDLFKRSCSLGGTEELPRFFRAIISLNCSFVLRAGTQEAHV